MNMKEMYIFKEYYVLPCTHFKPAIPGLLVFQKNWGANIVILFWVKIVTITWLLEKSAENRMDWWLLKMNEKVHSRN